MLLLVLTMPTPEKFTTKIIVTEQKQIHKGRNASGTEYTIWQVIAQKENGQPISQDMNLRSFDQLPKNQVVEVEVETYHSEQYGTSYTVTQKGKRRGTGLAKRVDELFAAMKRLNARLAAVEAIVGTSGAQPQPSAPPQQAPPPPSQPPPPPPPVGDGMPGDDIPF